MIATTQSTARDVELLKQKVRLLEGGHGERVWVLHHSTGNPGWLDLYDRLAQSYAVTVPDMPGFGASGRPDWARDARDLAILMHLLLDELSIDSLSLVGLGFGGWIAAEMATMQQRRIKKLVLVGAPGVLPREGEILDEMVTAFDDYIRAGFHDVAAFEREFSGEVDAETQDVRELNREMTARLAWRPYMYSRALPHLLPAVQTPTLIVWGSDDRVVPLDCGRHYQELLPNARLEVIEGAGHLVDMEQPEALARLIAAHLTGG
ncbi:MAG: alpha/beta hydrolase [Dehalococcoidia bacterium]|nr:alpha/beta hydrolase [Dehalococcoidia bacterium]